MSTDDEFVVPSADTTAQATGNSSRWSDARHIREHHGIPGYDRERFDYQKLVPNVLEHVWEGSPQGATKDKGGTDWLATGKPGSGKSTLGMNFAVRMMEINDEAVVWRGTPARSEWLPLAPWTTVCLPERVDVTARLEPRDPTRDTVEVALEDIVREVKRYANPVQLNRQLLDPGQFHVVYPDPRMAECQLYYEDSEKQRDGVEFAAEDPLDHWWFAWVMARIEYGPHGWMTAILDEIGDICPESAGDDAYGTLPKIKLIKDYYVDARKYGLSFGLFGHSEADIHNELRRKVRWRIQMPGSANPTTGSQLVGFNSVPMETTMTERSPVGEALIYTESNFEKFGWADLEAPLDRKLKVHLEA